MDDKVVYRQINKDYAYWIEKRRIGQAKGGQVAGLLTHRQAGQIKQNILFDAGLGTIEGLADCYEDAFWDEPLVIFITHGHIDHHAELMILSEIYCQRRGQHIRDIRPPLMVCCTAETQQYLYDTHRYGYTDGATLQPNLLMAELPMQVDIFKITPLAVDHFEGAVIYIIEFELEKSHKIIIGWDTTTLPLAPQQIKRLRYPSLALLEATTWTSMMADTGHSGVEDLVKTGFLKQLQLRFQPEQEQYGAYLVHYSGWEDPEGMLTDQQLKAKFDQTFPSFAPVVRVAERGQHWSFT
jgi:hypothetical protein